MGISRGFPTEWVKKSPFQRYLDRNSSLCSGNPAFWHYLCWKSFEGLMTKSGTHHIPLSHTSNCSSMVCWCWDWGRSRSLPKFGLSGPFSWNFPPKLRNAESTKFGCAETLAHQYRTIAIASAFRVDGAKSPEIPQKEGALGSEIAARNRKSLATFHRTLKSQCSIAFSCLGHRAISGVRDGHRNRKSQKSLRFRCAKAESLSRVTSALRKICPQADKQKRRCIARKPIKMKL